MNNYRVRVTRRDGAEMWEVEIRMVRGTVRNEFMGDMHGKFSCESRHVDYVVDIDEEAVYVYGLLKHSLNLKVYSVTLELPGKEAR